MMAGYVLGADDILGRGCVRDADVLALRRYFYQNGLISAEEADALIAIHASVATKDASWAPFYIEALVDFIVVQIEPQGYVTAANSEWLLAKISTNGVANSRADLDLAVAVMERARWSPISLARFALNQVRMAAIDGTGPLRTTSSVGAGKITDNEVDLLRRILYAFGGEGHIAVTRDEAEVLFDIDDALADRDPNPAWTDLFVKAVANVVMASSGYAVPSREEALRRETSLYDSSQKTSVLAFLLSMVRSNLMAVRDAYHEQSPEERALARLEHQRIEIITNEVITQAEATWLAARLERDGRLSASELALVAYLNQESTRIHPSLREAVERLGRAA